MEDRLAIAVIILLAVSLVIIGGMKFYEAKVQISDATDYVLEDLVGKHPSADSIEIMDWETKENAEGQEYLRIRASVTNGIYTPCPVRVHYFYHYPVQNFVTDTPEYITTSQCTTCEGHGCAIAFQEEAIIASHTNKGAENVHGYITGYGNTVPTVYPEANGWKVRWDSPSAKFGYVVEVARNGEIVKVDTVYY